MSDEQKKEPPTADSSEPNAASVDAAATEGATETPSPDEVLEVMRARIADLTEWSSASVSSVGEIQKEFIQTRQDFQDHLSELKDLANPRGRN